MRRASWPLIPDRSAGRRLLAFVPPGRPRGAGLRPRGEDRLHERLEAPDRAADPAAGPERSSGSSGSRASSRAYERTSIYPKLTGYIEKWNVDIGDKVKKGDVLATLFVPELVEDFGTKKATVKLDEERVELARKMVEVAEADVKAAEARLAEAKAILAKYQAEVDRWDSEVKRLETRGRAGRGRPPDPPRVDQPVEVEHRRAGRGEGDHREGGGGAALQTGHAREGQGRRRGRPGRPGRGRERGEAARGLGGLPHAHRALRRRDRGPQRQHRRLRPARHRRPHGHGACSLPVARAAPRRSTWSTAPTSSGSSSTSPSRTPTTSTSGRRRRVLVKAYRDEPIPGTVTRTSWALNVKSRTLRAEIDLPNPGSQLLPGMYAYAKVIIERPGVRALPAGRPHLQRRQDLLLDVRGRPCGADRDPDGRQRRRVDRGHQSPAPDGVQRRSIPGRRSTARNR